MTGPRSEPPMPMLITLRMRFPVCPFQLPSRSRLAKSAILSRTSWTAGTTFWPPATIEAPRGARSATWSTERSLRHIDRVAPKHGIDALTQTRFLGEAQQQLHGFVGDAILGIIEIESCRLGHQSLAALGILIEELAKMQALDRLAMGLERSPSRALAQCDRSHLFPSSAGAADRGVFGIDAGLAHLRSGPAAKEVPSPQGERVQHVQATQRVGLPASGSRSGAGVASDWIPVR